MQISVYRFPPAVPLALAACLTVVSACSNEDDRFVVPDDSPLDIWLEDVEFIDATNVPQVQIERFVAANGIDTTVTETGLVYEMLEEGTGDHPSADARVTVNYRGYKVNGQIFDQSTVQGPSELQLTAVISAWTEGLQLMRPGGRMWMLVRPSLGYGSAGVTARGVRISGSDVIVFEIDLIEFTEP